MINLRVSSLVLTVIMFRLIIKIDRCILYLDLHVGVFYKYHASLLTHPTDSPVAFWYVQGHWNGRSWVLTPAGTGGALIPSDPVSLHTNRCLRNC